MECMTSLRSTVLRAAGLTAAAGVLGFTWAAAIEPHLFRVRRFTLPLLPEGATPMRVLHLSDLHLTAWQHHKMTWVNSLSALEPDLVVNTGDNMAGDVLGHVVETYGALLDVPGVFVLGSNDFHAPQFKNPARYLRGPSEVAAANEAREVALPTEDLVDAFESRAWTFLDNRNVPLEIKGNRISFSGLGDAHMNRDEIGPGHPEFDEMSDLALGVTHAPYVRTLDAFTEAGADLVLAGHTHGGQIRTPFWGAPVTNCDLPRDRARGVFEHRGTTVGVSAGLGFSPFAPVRFACPPEVSVYDLVPGRPPRL